MERSRLTYEGVEGRVTFPDIGALIGYFNTWRLRHNERFGDYTLHATFGYLNRNLWDKHERGELAYEREITLKLGKDKVLRLEQAGGGQTSLTGNDLVMENVTLR